jgi:methionyl-tRNA formyltransferase
MKIVFVGTVKFSEILLKKMVSIKAKVAHVITKRASKFNSDFVDLGPVCRKFNISYSYAGSINLKKNIKLIRDIAPDVVFCFGWSELLESELLAIPKIGVVGYHPALLPQNRGRHPLIWALALGLRETGSTFFFMNKCADSGAIISQRKVKISYRDDASSLYTKMALSAAKQLEDFLPLLASQKIIKTKQDWSRATYWRKRTVNDGLIEWRMSSFSIYNLVRALARPYPGAHFMYKGREVKVWLAREVKSSGYANIEPGKVMQAYSKRRFLIKTGDNCILIKVDADLLINKGDYL